MGEDYEFLWNPDCEIAVKFRNGRETTFYYNSKHKIIYGGDKNIFAALSDEANDYLASLIGI